MRAAAEGSLPPVMRPGNLVEVLGREGRQGSPGELMVECSPSRQRRPPCKTNKEMSDEAADAAALTYLLTAIPARARRPTTDPATIPAIAPPNLRYPSKKTVQWGTGENLTGSVFFFTPFGRSFVVVVNAGPNAGVHENAIPLALIPNACVDHIPAEQDCVTQGVTDAVCVGKVHPRCLRPVPCHRHDQCEVKMPVVVRVVAVCFLGGAPRT